MEPAISLDKLLSGQAVGAWVVLDHEMKQILGVASTPEEAMRNAGIEDHLTKFAGEQRPVVLQVPDPAATCLY